ncbi:MAG: tetratricopeptide repeat protein [Planctomycetia bacterium]|nr:tetratricopeptide repeat protein [Planctomycetia bacterium]
MSSDHSEKQENAGVPAGTEISAAKRKQLQRMYDHGTLQSNQNNFDYATELLLQCVSGDPGNVVYTQGLLANLKKKYANNRKGHSMAFLKMMGPRGAAKKALGKEDWRATIENALKALQWNPWDPTVLNMLVKACMSLGFVESPLVYLKTALEGNPKDVEINRWCGAALEELGRINEAYQCWRRVGEAKPNDEEADRNMARLTVARTINESGYSAAPTPHAGKIVQAKNESGATVEMTHEEVLEQSIRQHPKDASKYTELAEIYVQTEDFDKAEDVLLRAVKACGPGDGLQDKLEDVQMRLMRQKIAKVERGSEEWKALRKELNDRELAIWKDRCERYPNNLGFKYDLGLRYQMSGDINEAIKQFQIAKKEPRRSGLCCLALGQCFQHIEQFSLAMANLEEAIEKIPDRDAENKKKAYYLAGKLLMQLNELDKAKEFLTKLADMDFSYRDVSKLLGQIDDLRKS